MLHPFICAFSALLRIISAHTTELLYSHSLNSVGIENDSSKLDEYLVSIDIDENDPQRLDRVIDITQKISPVANITKRFKTASLGLFSALLDADSISRLSSHTHVRSIDYNAPVSLTGLNDGVPWGLQRISTHDDLFGADPKGTHYEYYYSDDGQGAGVDVYIIDAGVDATHHFLNNKVVNSWTFTTDFADRRDHGTAVACILGGCDSFGVAPAANFHNVKASDIVDGRLLGMSSDIINAIEYVIQQHTARSSSSPEFKASVINLSLGANQMIPAWDRAVKLAVSVGIHFVVSAGNDARDACEVSPSLNGGLFGDVIVVGARDIDGEIPIWANRGDCVDVYAPGVSILTLDSKTTWGLRYRDGTSFAAPFVAGIVANWASQNKELAQSPVKMKHALRKQAWADPHTFRSELWAYNNVDENGKLGSFAKRRRRRTRSLHEQAVLTAAVADTTGVMNMSY